MDIKQERMEQLQRMIEGGDTQPFYTWREWLHTRQDVFTLDHWECQGCKAKGRYSKAVLVHHVKHLKDRPDLALSIWDGDERQLVSLCKACHEAEHPEAFRPAWLSDRPQAAPVTAERWD